LPRVGGILLITRQTPMAGLVATSTMLDRLGREVAPPTGGPVVFVAVNARVGAQPRRRARLGSALSPTP
jgi:hypothetical protein